VFDSGDIVPVMDGQLLRTAEPDGALRYRTDITNTRVAVLPATCKLGLHALRPAQSGAIIEEGEVRLSCPVCAAMPGVDHCWRLTVTGASPERAELDDEPYVGLLPRRAPTPALR
jgi:hypothetical protein